MPSDIPATEPTQPSISFAANEHDPPALFPVNLPPPSVPPTSTSTPSPTSQRHRSISTSSTPSSTSISTHLHTLLNRPSTLALACRQITTLHDLSSPATFHRILHELLNDVLGLAEAEEHLNAVRAHLSVIEVSVRCILELRFGEFLVGGDCPALARVWGDALEGMVESVRAGIEAAEAAQGWRRVGREKMGELAEALAVADAVGADEVGNVESGKD